MYIKPQLGKLNIHPFPISACSHPPLCPLLEAVLGHELANQPGSSCCPLCSQGISCLSTRRLSKYDKCSNSLSTDSSPPTGSGFPLISALSHPTLTPVLLP